jgi:integrase
MTTDTFSDKLERICKYVKIPIKRLHKIRKAYASMLLDAGVPESIVTNQMGHSDITTTLGYYYKDRHTDAEKVEAVSKALAFPVHLVS